MNFELTDLPYSEDALEPHLSARTLHVHHQRHHGGYLAKLAEAIQGKPLGEQSLDAVIRETDGSVRNWASQVYNHSLYWRSLSPDGGGEPRGSLLTLIESCFGSTAALRRELGDAAKNEFGSGWAWLLCTTDGRLSVCATTDAESPLTGAPGAEGRPLLTIDVWEHAYYLDYQHDRGSYAEAVLDHLIDWDGAAVRLQQALAPAEESSAP